MSQDESSLGRKVGKNTIGYDSDEDESDDSQKTKPRRRNPDQTSLGIEPLKEGMKQFKDDAKHYHSKSESENGTEGHLEDLKVARRAKGDVRNKSHLKGETNMRDDLSEDEDLLYFKKETKLSSMEDHGDRKYESCPKPTRTTKHHDEERKNRGLNLELQDRKITYTLRNQQTNNNVQISGESGDDSSENHLRERREVQKKSDVKKGNHNMLHQHGGSDSDSHSLSERTMERQVEESTLKKGSLKRSTKKNSHDEGRDDSSENNLRERNRGQRCDVRKGNRNMLHQHVGSDSDSDNLSERTMKRQVEESALKKERRSARKNYHIEDTKGGSGSESDSESRNKLSSEDIRERGKLKQERCIVKKISLNESESDSEYEQHSKGNGRKKLSGKDTREFGTLKEEREISKRNPDKKMSKYEEQSRSDSSEDKKREKRPHSQVSPVAKEAYYSEVKTTSHSSDRRQSGRDRESKNHSSSTRKGKRPSLSFSESDSDSDNAHVKEVKDSRGARHDSTEKTMKKSISKQRKDYRKQEAESQSELSDESYADVAYKEELYKRNRPRRRENMMSYNDTESDPNEEQQRLYTLRAKSEHQRKGDMNESYDRNFQEKMQSIHRNLSGRQSESHSSLVEKERHTEHFTSKHSREKYERNGGGSAYQQTGSESESGEQGFRNTPGGRVKRSHKKSAHGIYKELPYGENKHLKNMNEGKREDTMQQFDYENDEAEYSSPRNIQRRRDEMYTEMSDQDYRYKQGRSKEPKGSDAVRGTRDVYKMSTTEQYSDEFQMAERRAYRRQPRYNYENAKDDRKEDYRRKKWNSHSSDEEDLGEQVPSLIHQPNRPGQHRNIAKQRVYGENARTRIPNIRRRPVKFNYDDDDEEEDEEEYVPIRTPRKQKADQNTPNLYDHVRRGAQNSTDIHQEFCRRRNYSLRDRHHDFSFPKDVPRQRNYFPNEAPVYQRPPREERRARGPQALIDLSIREDPRKHRVQAPNFASDEDDDDSEYEEVRGQKHKFSGMRRGERDNARLRKGHWIPSEASAPGSEEDYSGESEDERHVGPEPVVHQEMRLTPGKLISVLAKKKDLRATLLQLLEYHHMKTRLVRRVVLANPHLFKMAGEIIEIRLNIKICTAHNGTRGCFNRSTCQDMHICAKYVRGKCDSEECVMGHHWLTRHNMGILSQLKIQNLSEEFLERLLQSSFSNTGTSKSEPSVCYKYNKGECQRQQCQQLHICYTYITNNLMCAKNKCKLNHSLLKLNCRRVLEAADIDVNESPKDVLAALLEANPALEVKDERTKIRAGQDQGKGITTQPDQEQGSGRKDHSNKTDGDKENKFNKKKKIRTFWSTQAHGEVNIVEICYNSVESVCPSEASGCQRLHALEHYHWQMSENGSNWLNLQIHQVKALERAFCDVNSDGIEMPRVESSQQVSLLKKLGRDTWTADFKTMKIVNSSKTISFQIRRLCTETVPGKVIDAAVNVWYFLDKQQNWVEYGKVDSVGETNLVVSLASDAIEKEFLKDSTASIQLKNSKFTYSLDFKSMAQTNMQTQVTREVRRRPQIHLQEEEDQEQKQRKLPAHWDEMKSNERVKRVVINASGDEYKKILPLLGNISSNVTKIERVQNRFHWQAFQNKIEEMADIYGDPTKVNIRQLFHGTGHDIVPKICNENFDPKLHGQSAGQAYGQGTYFARDASLSYGYCKTDSSGLKYMFIAKVAVGSLTTGNSSMARPPINSSTGYPFDSTGDNATNPSIIVKYDKAEYFPEYIFTLK